MTSTSRISVRHAGDHSSDWLAEQDRKAAKRQAELAQRIAETDAELVAAAEVHMRRRRR